MSLLVSCTCAKINRSTSCCVGVAYACAVLLPNRDEEQRILVSLALVCNGNQQSFKSYVFLVTNYITDNTSVVDNVIM